MFNFWKRKFIAVHDVVRCTNGGVIKRIDENRELLELLQREAPGLLEAAPWVEGWFKRQDEFLTLLAEKASDVDASGVTPLHPLWPNKSAFFPRPWPGSGS